MSTMRALLLAPLVTAALVSPAAAGKVVVPDDEAVDAAYASRRVALLVGVDRYADPDLEQLAFAGKDAHDVADALRDPSVGGFDEVIVLTGAEATSREAILATLEEVTADLQRDDTFLMYLSGHGTLTLDPLEGTRLWFLPSDAELSDPDQEGLDVAWLESSLTALTPRRRVLIMDTCHNGRADGSRAALNAPTRDRLASLRGEPPAPNPVAQVTESEARLYAAQYYQPAMEDKALGNGVYTHFLLQALRGDRGTADLDRDGLVDVAEAHDYAQDRTIRHTGGLQVPRAEYRIVGREAIYLSGDPTRRAKAENALVSAYNGLLASARLFVDGQSRGALPGVVAIEPGTHHLEIQTADGRTIYAERVNVTAGQHLQVEDLMAPRSTRFTVQLGAVASHGADALAPLAPEIEVGVRPGVRGRWQPGAHLRVSAAGSDTPDWDLAYDADSRASTNTLMMVGGFMGFQPHDRITLGPELEAGLRWRRIVCEACASVTPLTEDDLSFQGALGLRAEWAIPTGTRADLTLRYDARALPIRAEQDRVEVGIVHGLAVGGSFE